MQECKSCIDIDGNPRRINRLQENIPNGHVDYQGYIYSKLYQADNATC